MRSQQHERQLQHCQRHGALSSNTTGNFNVASGYAALGPNTTGGYNTAIGSFAGANLTTGSNNIDIGNSGAAGESNTIRIGTTGTQTATYVAGIWGGNPGGGLSPVYVNSLGQLGAQASSRRFKKDIADMGTTSEALFSLRPVSFHYKEEFESKGIPQYGLIAEEVAKICPDLVVRDAKGEIYSVRYEAVNAMLLNEFLKEHRKNEQQGVTIARQQEQIEALTCGPTESERADRGGQTYAANSPQQSVKLIADTW